jgi:hypothetical protein
MLQAFNNPAQGLFENVLSAAYLRVQRRAAQTGKARNRNKRIATGPTISPYQDPLQNGTFSKAYAMQMPAPRCNAGAYVAYGASGAFGAIGGPD